MSNDSRPRVGRKRSEASRQAILDATLAILRREGYGNLTTSAIAAEAAVGKQTIYRWWTSKADVVLEALTEHARSIDAPVTGSLEGDLDAFLSGTFRLLHGPRGTGIVLKGLMAEAQLDPTFSARFAQFIEQRRTTLRSVVLRHAHEGDSIDALVDMLFGALWYRLLVGHASLDARFAHTLARLAARAVSHRVV